MESTDTFQTKTFHIHRFTTMNFLNSKAFLIFQLQKMLFSSEVLLTLYLNYCVVTTVKYLHFI